MPELPNYMNEVLITVSAEMVLEAEKASLTLEQVILRMKRGGMGIAEIEAILLRDLKEGGQIFGGFRSAFKAHVHYGLEELGRGAIIDMFEDDTLVEWVAVGDNRVCPDCLKRHNMPAQPMSTWERIGKPARGATICQEHCRCFLEEKGKIEKPDGGIVRKKG